MATSPSSQEIPLQVTPLNDGAEMIEFSPSVPGTYMINITYGNYFRVFTSFLYFLYSFICIFFIPLSFNILLTTGGCLIPGSPLICTVDATGQARAKGEGLLSGHVDKPAHFIITGTRSPPAIQVLAYDTTRLLLY
jgi:filamin